ncbi:activity-dependent neuroprotective protein a [Cololabis saira]|uniref:activity-dependent neuroprotective protein a n=1 Tax=Cololabis saira TaxID=129043 RepID=UPI002AD20C22|nr:activity-dependent neuroprotective protein a [Cololabis saira]
MYQLPVNNLGRIRKARKRVKKTLEDIGLDFCKEAAEAFKEFCPDEEFVKDTLDYDICTWDPSHSKTQEYRSKPFCCTECPFSSKYYSGYKNHFRNVHRKLLDGKILLNCPHCTFTASRRTLEVHVKIFHVPNLGQQCNSRALPAKKALPDSIRQGPGAERALYFCKKCSFRDTLYNVVRRHIYRYHFQHIVSPYLGVISESHVKNGASSVNGNIFCKQCRYSTRSYESMVQHVVEYHERIGSQVTTMIGHANVLGKPQLPQNMIQKGPLILTTSTIRGEAQSAAPPQLRVVIPSNSTGVDNSGAGVNTAQTQKWKICTVCNELFPENLYSAHFESAHKARKVWALAKYIMKIHNFTSKCLLCNRYLPSDTLLNHMLIHGLTCPQCHSAFHSVEKIMEHVSAEHPNGFAGPPGASPLTFDLTVKQGKSSNVQLAVLTFNMKETPNGQDQSAPGQKHFSGPGKLPSAKMIDKRSEPRGFTSVVQNTSVGKTVCPLCFTILKGTISDALALHLRERHQVLQTMHPVERKMTYKCIHCLGVYTSNMVASTITLHLVQCRAVGRNQASFKSGLTLNSSGAGILKRQLPAHIMSNAKKMKLGKDQKISAGTIGRKNEFDDLALDPRSFEHKTYEARKDFLTAYFNQRPYLSRKEEDTLSASLWLWKSDISTHFATKRRVCLRNCETKKLSVLLGFNMLALQKVEHNLLIEESLVGAPTGRSVGIKSSNPNTEQNDRCKTPHPASQLTGCTETISIDSDSEPEVKETTPSTPSPEENETTPSPEVKETSPSPEVKETSPSPEVKEISPSPEVKEISPSPEVKEIPPSPEVMETSPSPEVMETSPSPEVKEASPSTPSPEVKETTPSTPSSEVKETCPESEKVEAHQDGEALVEDLLSLTEETGHR